MPPQLVEQNLKVLFKIKEGESVWKREKLDFFFFFCNCRCGFAQSQEAYDRAVNDLFSTLDKLEDHLPNSRYLCGDTLTLVDICLFTTLIRFDLAYNVLFKCTKKKLCEMTR